MKRILRFSMSIVFVFLIGAVAFVQSQSTTGLIQGNVADPNGAAVQGATVTISNIDTGFERSVTSNSDGFFSAPLLPLGKYRVTTTWTIGFISYYFGDLRSGMFVLLFSGLTLFVLQIFLASRKNQSNSN